jgi:CubicO group peptidase (beta-lactamase class C family)
MRLTKLLCIAASALALGLPAAAQPAAGPAGAPASLTPPAPRAEAATPASTLATPAPAGPQLNRADLEAWLDGFLPDALAKGDVAGAVVVVVKDGQVLLQKGYGYADVAKKIPVDPAKTLFRPGSVSKLFTWTAVMQLVEQGKLNLDADVNTYLDFKIPPRQGKPITLRNIMTHSAGFEEVMKSLMSSDPKGPVPLGTYLKAWVPERIFAPGEVPAYSNYATALAGYIVQRTSGQSYDDYIEQHILQPLGMNDASFRQPLPDRLKPQMSQGYAVASGPAKPYEMVSAAPAGSLAASGADMGKFMIAHLQNGTYNGAQILKPETAKMMHETPTEVIPPLRGMRLGFYDVGHNGYRIIAHGGDTQWFHSDLYLLLDENVGIYMSVNSSGAKGAAGTIRSSLMNGILDRYFPAKAPLNDGRVDAKIAAQHAQQIAGYYISSRGAASSFMSMLGLFTPTKISAKDGTIIVPMLTDLNGQPKKWVEISPYVWREVGGQERFAAKVVDGKVKMVSYDEFASIMEFMPVPAWHGSLALLVGLSVAALLLTVILWPVAALARRRYGARFSLEGRDAKSYRRVRLAAIAVLLVFGGFLGLVTSMFSNFALLSPSMDGAVWALQIASLFAFVGGAIIGLWNLYVVWSGKRSWFAKLWSLILAASFLLMLLVAILGKLIAFDVNY